MENGALILEGGSLRSLFTSGVLDVFMENDLYFSDVTGVFGRRADRCELHLPAAGRTARINIGFVNDRRYLGVNNLLRHHEIFNFDFLFDEIGRRILPMDFETFQNSPMRFTAVATNLETRRGRIL